jgi:hypothetical protein
MDREDIMGTPSPELKQLWIRVLKRVHPDLAIDEQDRVRCERLTQLANEAYQAGDEEALRAVLRPSMPASVGVPWAYTRAYTRPRQGQKVSPPAPAEPWGQQGSPAPDRTPKRSVKSWFGLSNVPPVTAFSFKQLLSCSDNGGDSHMGRFFPLFGNNKPARRDQQPYSTGP